MIIIHSMTQDALPRLVADSLAEHLRLMPSVVVTGARQTGKSTLVRELQGAERRYITLDDAEALGAARTEPEQILAGPRPVTIDEVQREPQLMLAIKREIDERRAAGRFLLTGSANLLLMKSVSETLAGRASYLTLWPMTRTEQLGLARCGVWDQFFEAPPQDWLEMLGAQNLPKEDWRALARRGGFPPAAIQMRTDRERAIWFDGYVRTYLERDLQSLSNISALPDFRRLMQAVSLRVGQLVNQTALGRDIGMAQPTVHRYLNLLETSYLLVRLPAYAVNRNKRLIKSPKIYWSDSGIAWHLSQQPEPQGALLENLVLQDLLAWRDSGSSSGELFFWRSTLGEEVDFVIESGGRLLPLEVKSSRRTRLSDTKHLRTFIGEYPERSLPGLLLYDGERAEWIGPDVLAVPWWMAF